MWTSGNSSFLPFQDFSGEIFRKEKKATGDRLLLRISISIKFREIFFHNFFGMMEGGEIFEKSVLHSTLRK